MATKGSKSTTAGQPPDPGKLVRTAAGRYATGDERFVVEQSSGGWMLTDATQSNDLGLPLVRGPFATLDAARETMAGVRSGPAPISDLAERIAAIPKRQPAKDGRTPVVAQVGRSGHAGRAAPKAKAAAPLPVVVREFRSRDGDGLRALWDASGFGSLGDDDMSLRRFAQRNPGLLLVAARGIDVVGSVMGGWDGRRGWVYHVAVAEGERRRGLATKLVRQAETGLRAVGCRKVNAIVRDGNDAASAFWKALGYEADGARQFGLALPNGDVAGE